MRHLFLVLLLVIGFESICSAYDIPPPSKMPNPPIVLAPDTETSNMPQVGTIVGGALLATAVLFGGLWLIRTRKLNTTN